jgi:hypothetical protein
MNERAPGLRGRGILLVAVLAMCAIAYLPGSGRTLYTDDLSRITDNADLSGSYFRDLLFDNKSDGFYRPLNHLTFGLTYYLFGLSPAAFGAFNFLLLAGCVYLLFRISELLTSDPVFAALLTAAWLANTKVISSTVTWAVGRTTGLYTFFLLLAILLVLTASGKRAPLRLGLACGCTVLALLSKESAAVALPFIVAALAYQVAVRRRLPLAHAAWMTAGLVAIYGLYFFLRAQSLAMGPESAPFYYRWDPSPAALLSHARSYATRSLAFAALVVPTLWFVMPRREHETASVSRREALIAAGLCALGFAAAIAPMLPVPFKSNLYAFFPGIFVVGGILSLCRLSRRWPAPGSLPLRRTLAVIALMAVVTCPLAWHQGLATYRHNHHVLAWAETLSGQLPQGEPASVVVRYSPEVFADTHLEERDFAFLRMVLALEERDFQILVNPDSPGPDWPVFELHPDSDGGLLGVLTPAQSPS